MVYLPAGTPLMGSTSVDANIATLASSAWLGLDGLAWAARNDSQAAAAPASAGSSTPSSSELTPLVTFCSEERTQRCLARFLAQGSDVWSVAPSLTACALLAGGQAAEWLQRDNRWAAGWDHAGVMRQVGFCR
jgi:hypothetical protein